MIKDIHKLFDEQSIFQYGITILGAVRAGDGHGITMAVTALSHDPPAIQELARKSARVWAYSRMHPELFCQAQIIEDARNLEWMEDQDVFLCNLNQAHELRHWPSFSTRENKTVRQLLKGMGGGCDYCNNTGRVNFGFVTGERACPKCGGKS